MTSERQRGRSQDRPIKVCFIMPKAYPLFNPSVKGIFGGAEVDVALLARELAKDSRYDVACITADYGQGPVEHIDGVKVMKSLNFKHSLVSQTVRLWQVMQAADADVYFQEAASAGTFLTALFCRRRDKIFIYRTASTLESDGGYLHEHPVVGRLFGWALRQARRVIAQNQSDMSGLDRTFGVRATVIPNSHPIPELSACPSERRSILWVGRSERVKQPGKFLQLARELPEEHFTMICSRGTGDKNYDKLRDQARRIENLEFIEGVAFSRIDPYFRSAKIFVNTSDSEGFPNTFIHAGLYAASILSLNVNPDHFLDRFECGLCAGGDWENFVSQCKHLIQPENIIRFGSQCRKYVENNHDIEKNINQYKKIFFDIADEREFPR
jgi:glycosyltransferase involved in cell wall biosynthesis